MRYVWKYRIPIMDTFELTVPEFANPLDVQVIGDVPYMWMLVDDEEGAQTRRYQLRGTGQPVDHDDTKPELNYVGTFQLGEGALVFHLFEEL